MMVWVVGVIAYLLNPLRIEDPFILVTHLYMEEKDVLKRIELVVGIPIKFLSHIEYLYTYR
jgi:hypothetical protein